MINIYSRKVFNNCSCCGGGCGDLAFGIKWNCLLSQNGFQRKPAVGGVMSAGVFFHGCMIPSGPRVNFPDKIMELLGKLRLRKYSAAELGIQMASNLEVSDHIAGFVLAGGQSSRMGTDKALLEIDGIPLLVRAARLVASVASSASIVGHPDRHSGFGFEVIRDRKEDIGGASLDYMNGIITALEHTTAKWNLIISVDMPYLTAEWLQYMVDCGQRTDVDLVTGGFCNLYQKRSLPGIMKAFDESAVSFGHTMQYLSYYAVSTEEWQKFDPAGNLFLDIDTPEELERARRLLSRGEGKPSFGFAAKDTE